MVTKSYALLSRPQRPHNPHYTFQLRSLDPNPRAKKKTMMASSAALLQASAAFAPVFSPLPSRLQPAPRLHLRGSPNRRRHGVALAASSAASAEVEKEPSTSLSPQESQAVSSHGGCSRDAGTYSWVKRELAMACAYISSLFPTVYGYICVDEVTRYSRSDKIVNFQHPLGSCQSHFF